MISQIKTLRQLDLSANTEVTDVGVKYLTGIPQIEELSISGWKLTPACIPYFKKFTNLKTVAIHADRWAKDDLDRLRSEIPKADLRFHHLQYADY